MPVAERRTYSERLGEITAAQLQRACDAFDLGRLESAEPPSAGNWGQNVLLVTTTGRFVLRGNPQTPEQLPKERAVAAAIAERSSLPAPWPYRLTTDPDIFGWPFAVMPHLPGTMGATLWEHADDDGKIAMAAAHAEALARLHEAAFEAPGAYDLATDSFTSVADHRAWTVGRIDLLRERCDRIDALSTDDGRFVDDLIHSCAAALSEPFVPVIVHHDFSLANTSYEEVDGHFDCTGVFDLGEAHIGDGEEDLVRFLFRRKRAQRDAFVDAYVSRRPLRPGAGDRLALYALADVLFMWLVSRSGTGWFGDASFVEAATPVIDRARDAGGR